MKSDRTALIINNVIEIQFSFDWGLVRSVGSIPGRKFIEKNKSWHVPFSPFHCDKVIKTLSVLDFWIDPTIKKCADATAPMPALELPDTLFDYQKTGVEFAYGSGGRCIIADDMGLGKTIEALTLIDKFFGKTLIVVPQSVLWKWKNEADKWTHKTSVVIETGKSKLVDADIHIMTYGIMLTKFSELLKTPYSAIVFDEAHYLKSFKAKRTKIARDLVKEISHVLFLTGTPVLNRPIELFPILSMLDKQVWGNWAEYVERYCDAQVIIDERGKKHWDVPRNGASNLDELSRRLSTIVLRRTKKQVSLQLPELMRSYIPVGLDNLSEYKVAKRSISAWMAENRGTANYTYNNILVKMNILRQIAGRGKTPAAIELAKLILESEDRVVLFAHHKEVVAILVEGLKEYNVGVISGDVSSKKRQEQIDSFLSASNETLSHKNQIRVMICTTAGAEGIDLYTASNVIFVEREWTPAREAQMESRLHRNGQRNNVTASYLIALGTIDETISALVDHKKDIIQQIISSDKVAEQWLGE